MSVNAVEKFTQEKENLLEKNKSSPMETGVNADGTGFWLKNSPDFAIVKDGRLNVRFKNVEEGL